MKRTELKTTSFDATQLKSSLLEFLANTDEFGDFNFEGSAINTIVDLLVYDTSYNAFLANMLANESFIESAQSRANVVSHAEKLSYIPKSATASRLICDIEVTPADPSSGPTSIVMEQGSSFLSNVNDTTYTFTNLESHRLTWNQSRGTFRATDVTLYQGQLLRNRFVHEFGQKHVIPNENCDRSSLLVQTSEASGGFSSRVYQLADAISQLDQEASVYFASENHNQLTEVSFGRDIIGREPQDGTVVTFTYIGTEDEHANGVSSLFAASTIGNYSDISVDVTTPSYGGTDAEDIDRVRFIAPKYYQAQGRALTDSDYIPILKSMFPFIQSAISWGGEKNDPPAYGNVYISIISDEGDLITNAVKQQMVAALSERNVGSITPIITDPETFGLDLDVSFSYNNRNTSKTYNGLDAEVQQVIDDYNTELNDFDAYYNQSELVSRIMDIQGVTSVDIDKTVFRILDVLRFRNPIYTARFDNELIPSTVHMEGFTISSDGSDHRLYDEDGVVFVEYTRSNGSKVQTEVGEVDYERGIVEFTINMIQDNTEVKLEVQTKEDNFYVVQNRVVYINDVSTRLLETRDRQTSESL